MATKHSWTSDNGSSKWLYGVIVPSLVSVYALSVLLSGRGTLLGFGRLRARLHLQGTEAMVYGVLLLGAAFALHCHFLWSNTEKLNPYSDVGKVAGCLVFIVGAAYLIYHVLILA